MTDKYQEIIKNHNWKDVVGYEGIYKVSDAGHVISFAKNKEGKLRIPTINSTGYFNVGLCKKGKYVTRKVHRLMAIAFFGKSKLLVNHKNGIKTDNRLSNLEYVTDRENVNHFHKNTIRSLPKGVFKYYNKYRAAARLNGKLIVLGAFDTSEEARIAYLNFIIPLKETKYAE